MGTSGHNGKPKPFANDCSVTETKKNAKTNPEMLNFLRKIKHQVFSQFDVFHAFTMSPLNNVSYRYFLLKIIDLTSKAVRCFPT